MKPGRPRPIDFNGAIDLSQERTFTRRDQIQEALTDPDVVTTVQHAAVGVGQDAGGLSICAATPDGHQLRIRLDQAAAEGLAEQLRRASKLGPGEPLEPAGS